MSATGPTLHPNDPLPGTKYRIVKPLGAGGMGVVYQVVKPPNIQGVLKLMSSELTSHEDLLVRFFDEVRILAQLDHPNIVKVFDYDSLPDGTPFYVMELLNGSTVRDVLYTIGRVPPRVAYEITRQLLEALQCAHTHEVPVIHRDIKPENIFLHAPRHGEPVVKLIDFGVSAVADRLHDDQFVGTWGYAAPEQIRGEKPTPATDLYSTALVLYEMLAGVGPFSHHDDWPQLSEAQLKEIPAPVSKFAPWVPRSIVELIASSLEKDPRNRPRDAYSFAERLFELEWATEGRDPHDLTSEGPLLRPPSSRASAPEPDNAGNARNGALALILESVTGQVRIYEGGRPKEPTALNTNGLLAGLSATPRKPASRRERESDPDGGTPHEITPRPGQVVILAGKGASRPHEHGAPTTPRAMPVATPPISGAITIDGPKSAAPPLSERRSDPFVATHPPVSSVSGAASRPPSRSRLGLATIAAAIIAVGLAITMIVIVRARRTSVNATTSVSAVGANAPAAPRTTVTVNVDPSPPEPSAVASAAADPLATPSGSRSGVRPPPRPAVTPRPPSAPAAPASAPAPGRGDYMRNP